MSDTYKKIIANSKDIHYAKKLLADYKVEVDANANFYGSMNLGGVTLRIGKDICEHSTSSIRTIITAETPQGANICIYFAQLYALHCLEDKTPEQKDDYDILCQILKFVPTAWVMYCHSPNALGGYYAKHVEQMIETMKEVLAEQGKKEDESYKDLENMISEITKNN